MNEPHYGHAGTVYGGYMYISGKWLQGGYLSEFVIIQNKDGSIMLWDCLWSLKKKDWISSESLLELISVCFMSDLKLDHFLFLSISWQKTND